MKEKNILKDDVRIEKILNLLLKYTLGDYSAREVVSSEGDELDAIIIGLNTLGEEAESSGKIVRDFEKRVGNIMDVLLKYTLFDFSEKIQVGDVGDELDAIAIGLNTMAEELEAARQLQQIQLDKIKLLNKELLNNNTQLESSNNELEAFTYSVSHDLRAPLRAIHGYTAIIEKDYSDKLDDDAKNMLKAVMNNALKMGQLIDDLLALSRFGKKELQKKETDMTQLAEQCLEELKKSANVSRAKIVIRPLHKAIVDSSLMSQVFFNLLSNAVKYSSLKDKPEIILASKTENDEIIYFISDNGTGFDMKYYNKLFGVFQRLHDTDEFEGTGVGLALVKRIVTRHNGRVWAEAEVGKGATFYFALKNEN